MIDSDPGIRGSRHIMHDSMEGELLRLCHSFFFFRSSPSPFVSPSASFCSHNRTFGALPKIFPATFANTSCLHPINHRGYLNQFNLATSSFWQKGGRCIVSPATCKSIDDDEGYELPASSGNLTLDLKRGFQFTPGLP